MSIGGHSTRRAAPIARATSVEQTDSLVRPSRTMPFLGRPVFHQRDECLEVGCGIGIDRMVTDQVDEHAHPGRLDVLVPVSELHGAGSQIFSATSLSRGRLDGLQCAKRRSSRNAGMIFPSSSLDSRGGRLGMRWTLEPDAGVDEANTCSFGSGDGSREQSLSDAKAAMAGLDVGRDECPVGRQPVFSRPVRV